MRQEPVYSEAGGRNEQEAIDVASFLLSLLAKGIRNTELLRAMELVPRDVFAPRRFRDLARRDIALPLPCGQTMTAPGTVALMLLALGVEPGQRVLEIGTGTGYVTALLTHLGAEVTTVERFNTLAESAAQHLKIVEANKVKLEVGDGLAARVRDRFDRVLLNGTWPDIPSTLTSLLGPSGRLVGALPQEDGPRLVQIDRAPDGEHSRILGAPLRITRLATGIAATL
ncbi:protein-L-isoaspartate O-methyltransferase family protein [Microvirga guangxiensis]|uniref:Protein-L-isoaspartate O-methyltransferase n=1 Tax=Microvirga guangxiensis TaxID=549386 RepID=A0A1G5B2Q3_9HYPH|nr:methyltransferase domain-containing protein [Microvirga guangxiensis]SCX84376.1 protein-L-isoaspartate(D-aspartate) O-methyltransferase [Microvirga guangxiensis]